ncbi:MAG: NYN domain-containing protein [Salinispira sp.]
MHIKLSDTSQAVFMRELLAELRRSRKVALRLGKLADYGFTIKPKSMKKIKEQTIELTEDDIELDIRQKQVDMKMGLDVSSLAYKKLVDQIIMVTGDSDFVPVAKTARREG